jgi:hypothetical protein
MGLAPFELFHHHEEHEQAVYRIVMSSQTKGSITSRPATHMGTGRDTDFTILPLTFPAPYRLTDQKVPVHAALALPCLGR